MTYFQPNKQFLINRLLGLTGAEKFMHRFLLACLLFLMCAASSCDTTGTATGFVAVGGTGNIPQWNGRCDTEHADKNAAVIFQNGTTWRATRPGRVRIFCEHGPLVLEAKSVKTLTIRGSQLGRVGVLGYSLHAAAAGGDPLDLGEGADIQWRLGPALRLGDNCNHMLGFCQTAERISVYADAPGSSWVEATFAGQQARLNVSIEK